MTTAAPVQVSWVSNADADDLADLFQQCSLGCYCRYWHHEGSSRHWLERCATASEKNEASLREALSSDSPTMQGLVAREGRSLVGWLKCAPATALGKIYEQRLYRGLPCLDRSDEGVFTIGCMLVRESHRRRGVARALLAAAVAQAPRFGATQLEAFPRSEGHVSDAALMMGPARLYAEAGFEVVHDFSPYPVLRKQLAVERPK